MKIVCALKSSLNDSLSVSLKQVNSTAFKIPSETSVRIEIGWNGDIHKIVR